MTILLNDKAKLMKGIFLLLFLFSFYFQAFSQDAVTLSNINLRESTSKLSRSLSIIPKGTLINIIKCDNDWCKINYINHTGYVRSELIKYKSEYSNKNTVNNNKVQLQVKHYTNSSGERVQSPTNYIFTPASATAICKDGTYSFSKSRQGTCSHHGGVKKWL
ncbi:MAG: DUF3761 domain-containing protein [Saprospiraceae bacterium]